MSQARQVQEQTAVRPQVSDGYLNEIARILKDHSTIAEIDRFFELADADSSWQIEPQTTFHQARAIRTLSWLQGIRRHAPNQLIRVTRSVVQQMLADIQFPDPKYASRLKTILGRLDELAVEEVQNLDNEASSLAHQLDRKVVFLSHGHDSSWGQLALLIRDYWDVELSYFEREGRLSRQIPEIIHEITHVDGVALILMTADDELANGQMRARQNVIHEAGMCHAVLGFDRVALLLEFGVEPFSNAQGIVFVPYNPQRPTECLHDVGEFFERHGIVRRPRSVK